MSQLPRSLHEFVNSGRSNWQLELAADGEGRELWSLPWHAQLRSLAKGLGSESLEMKKTAEASSWLLRARKTALRWPMPYANR